MKSVIALSGLAMASTAAARTLTVYNACPFTIWPALFTSSGGRPSQPTGWTAASFTKVTFDVPSDWDGRVWGRRNCNFGTNPGPNSCLDGGCNGGLVRRVKSSSHFILISTKALRREHRHWRSPPPPSPSSTSTAAEPTSSMVCNSLDQMALAHIAPVSLVDGYNLPMRIDNNVGCGIPSCPVDLGPNCPADQKGPFDSSGFPVGCKSACTVDALAGNVNNNPNCCTGTHDTQATCPASGVRNYSYFKSNCPNAYAFAYDEPSGTALWTCPTNKNAAYTITFCP
ncbi:hypothetical protein MVEN_00727300 [Mycena venus]|uniref:Thaumatin-like protein n=1 Tax=Mycena venus TaxID=2733690 RepID=A0A8H6YF42_9AGAR|nr:hypothetical protein MVEN_00727300 [Mycena venus]